MANEKYEKNLTKQIGELVYSGKVSIVCLAYERSQNRDGTYILNNGMIIFVTKVKFNLNGNRRVAKSKGQTNCFHPLHRPSGSKI